MTVMLKKIYGKSLKMMNRSVQFRLELTFQFKNFETVGSIIIENGHML